METAIARRSASKEKPIKQISLDGVLIKNMAKRKRNK